MIQTRKKYTKEFKAQAVELAQSGRPVAELAVELEVIDLCTRRIVGWSLEENMRAELVTAALGQALGTAVVAPGLIFHSDRGSQYGSGTFREQLAGISARQSMSRRANPYDNAWTESVIGTIKHELVQDGCFADIDDARRAIFDYIDGYYNTRRKHSSIGYITPNQCERRLNQLTLI